MNAAEAIAALDGLNELLKLITGWARQARERGEWTPEQQAAFEQRLTDVTNQPHWQQVRVILKGNP